MVVNGKKVKVWQIIVGIGIVLGVLGGFFTAEDRWNQTEEVMAAEKEIDHKVETVEKDFDNKLLLVSQEIIQTFESYQKKQDVQTNGQKLEILDMQYDTLTRQYNSVRKQLKDNPDDIELREELERIKGDRERVLDRKNKIMGD